MRAKPIVGQTLYSLNVGNAARHCEQKLTPVTVTKVGRKYFTCTKMGFSRGTEYHIDSWHEKTEYSPDSVLYESENEWELVKERRDLYMKIKGSYFSAYHNDSGIGLDKLRAIADILYDDKPQGQSK